MVHYRKPAPEGENTDQRLKRDRESDVWGDVIDQVGPPAPDTQWVHVLDRGADNFDVYCHCREQRSDWVVRASMLHRKVTDPEGNATAVRDLTASPPEAGRFTLQLRARPKQPARRARLAVRFTPVTMPVPWHKSRYVRRIDAMPVLMWLVVVAEVDGPEGVKPIDWVLYTSLPVESFEQAMVVVSYYEKRWLIEKDQADCTSSDRWCAATGASVTIDVTALLELAAWCRQRLNDPPGETACPTPPDAPLPPAPDADSRPPTTRRRCGLTSRPTGSSNSATCSASSSPGSTRPTPQGGRP